jgi:hypothetical protein
MVMTRFERTMQLLPVAVAAIAVYYMFQRSGADLEDILRLLG